MDPKTVSYYDTHASEQAEKYRKGNNAALLEQVSRLQLHGARALDIGCGSGRDMALLESQGFLVHGVDASLGMLQDSLPALSSIQNGPFDLILCLSVLMHIEDTELPAAINRIASLLVPAGYLICKLPTVPPQAKNENALTRIHEFDWPDAQGRGDILHRGFVFQRRASCKTTASPI